MRGVPVFIHKPVSVWPLCLSRLLGCISPFTQLALRPHRLLFRPLQDSWLKLSLRLGSPAASLTATPRLADARSSWLFSSRPLEIYLISWELNKVSKTMCCAVLLCLKLFLRRRIPQSILSVLVSEVEASFHYLVPFTHFYLYST